MPCTCCCQTPCVNGCSGRCRCGEGGPCCGVSEYCCNGVCQPNPCPSLTLSPLQPCALAGGSAATVEATYTSDPDAGSGLVKWTWRRSIGSFQFTRFTNITGSCAGVDSQIFVLEPTGTVQAELLIDNAAVAYDEVYARTCCPDTPCATGQCCVDGACIVPAGGTCGPCIADEDCDSGVCCDGECLPYGYSCNPCAQQTVAGGDILTITRHLLPEPGGQVTLSYEAFTIPDKFTLYYVSNNQQVAESTDAFVSGAGQIELCKPFGVRYMFVRVDGSSSGTAWEYTLSCPGEECSPLP